MNHFITDAISPRTYVPQDQLYVWAMINPYAPKLVGEVSLSKLVIDCATFTYAQNWWNFPLGEDMPIISGKVFSTGQKNTAPGAIDDARPDRWGERIIRHIDRPQRLSILEMLLFAGDDRFGALGISTSAEKYIPRNLGPYPQLKDLTFLAATVEDVQTQAPLTEDQKRLIQPGVTLGGARPKALLQTNNGPCVLKFSELDDLVDTPLIEHATMTLATKAGLYMANTGVLPLPPRNGKARHALIIKRFDRNGKYRIHCQSAYTALRAAGLDQSYSNLATILLRLGHPTRQAIMREELFKRMVFNILMDNTDDHERNHGIQLSEDGYYDLTPAYDVVPTLQNMSYQSLIVGNMGYESSLENALTQINEYGINKKRAVELIREVANVIDRWIEHFTNLNVSSDDIEMLISSIDRSNLRMQRKDFL